MRERKNIERLFQEKFKDFETTPNPVLWENIASKLEVKKQKKRPFLPFWYKMVGVAALLLIGFFTAENFTNVFSDGRLIEEAKGTVVVKSDINDKNENNVVNNDNQNVTNTADSRRVDSKRNKIETNAKNNIDLESIDKRLSKRKANYKLDQNGIVSVEDDRIKNSTSSNEDGLELNSISNQSTRNERNSTSFKNAKIVNTSHTISKPSIDMKPNPIVSATKEALVVTSNESKSTKSKYRKAVSHRESIVYQSNNADSFAKEDSTATATSKEVITASIRKNKGDSIASQRAVMKKNRLTTAVVFSVVSDDVKSNEKDKLADKSKVTIAENVVSNASEAVETKNLKEKGFVDRFSENAIATVMANKDKVIEDRMFVDSLNIAKIEENPLEKILREKENREQEAKKVVTQRLGKWKIKPNVAPIMTGSSQGSPIAGEFADNNKSYENSLGVGVGLDYAISKKVSIRTGLNKLSFGYNTNDIAYYADLNAGSKNINNGVSKTINLTVRSQNIVIEDKYRSAKNSSQSQEGLAASELAFQNKNEGYLNQKMAYVEVPMEISYALLDKKFGVQIFTGVSTLFLNENEISLVSSGLTTGIGEANNLNKVHFSTNIGVGFKYSFWKSFEVNFEPTFKYQVNTFNANSGGFKPYLIGLYSGVSFKF